MNHKVLSRLCNLVLAASDIASRIEFLVSQAKPEDRENLLDTLTHISCVGIEKDSAYQDWKNSDKSWEEAVKPALQVYRDWQKYLPWLANQIKKYSLEPERLLPWVEESKEDQKEGKLTLWSLIRKAGGDVNRLKLEDLLNELEANVDPNRPEQGEVVLKLENGWNLQKLNSKKSLEQEGQLLKHCVGGYWQDVRDGKTEIYSLRDSKGMPHLTFEWKNKSVKQIHGKADSYYNEFSPELQKLSREVVKKQFGNELNGRVLTAQLDEEIINKYSSSDWGRLQLARNPEIGNFPETAKLLAQESYVAVSLAGNKSIAKLPELFKQLSQSYDDGVRRSIAENPMLHSFPDIALKLAEDKKSEVRSALAYNTGVIENIPEIARILAHDDSEYVKESLALRYKTLEKYPDVTKILSQDASSNIRAYVARNVVLKKYPDIVRDLAYDSEASVRGALASNDALNSFPQDVVSALSKDTNPLVRIKLAANFNIRKFPDIVKLLANDEFIEVRRSLLYI